MVSQEKLKERPIHRPYYACISLADTPGWEKHFMEGSRDDVDTLALGFVHDVVTQLGSSLFYGSRRWHRSRDDLDPISSKGFSNPPPIT